MAMSFGKDHADCKCPLCSHTATTMTGVLSHMRAFHANDPNFCVTCGLNGCATSSRSFSGFYSHIYRHHSDYISKRGRYLDSHFNTIGSHNSSQEAILEEVEPHEVLQPTEQDLEVTADINYLTGHDREAILRSSALLILKLKNQCKLSQVAINNVVEGCRGLFAYTLQHLQAGLRSKLADLGFDHSELLAIQEVFSSINEPFDRLTTQKQQESYFLNELNLVQPQEILVGDPVQASQFSGSKRRLIEKQDSYQYVPLLQSLEALLSDQSIQEQVQKFPKRIRTDGKMEDYCDGARFKGHCLFSKDQCALQIIAHYDELEVCNPLGSHVKKHKVGVLSYTLGNVHPKYRSKLKLLQLAIVASIPVIERHGLHTVLRPFVHDLNILSTKGIEVDIGGVQETLKGALLAVLADNLASNDLGGFKKSFSFAFRSCRTCLVTKDTLSAHFHSEAYDKRNDRKHSQDLKEIESDVSGHYSKTYGINQRSVLMDVNYFSIFEGGLPHDLMHDLLEGLVPLEIKHLLSYYVSSGTIALQEFNDRLIKFNYGYSEKDKPNPILSTTLKPDKTIRASAAQMLLFVRILPFIIADKVLEDDNHWACFLLLRKILDVVLAPVATESHCSSLKLLIIDHHSQFFQLYGLYTPKMHFLLHYPEQLLNLGPLIRTWTMRYEAKLHFFKQSSNSSNFKNIALSLANAHQRWMCYEMATGQLISSCLECGPSNHTGLVQNENENLQQLLKIAIPHLHQEATVCRPAWARTNGILYQNNNAFLIVNTDGLDPMFGKLDDILVINNSVIVFQVFKCTTLFFDGHYHSYAIKVTSERSLHLDLLCYEVYHAHTLCNGYTYISLKYAL